MFYINPRYTSGSTGTVAVTGRIGIGTTAPAYQLELSLDSAGKPTTSIWVISSDPRIKTDLDGADLSMCYTTIKDLPLKRFAWDVSYIDIEVSRDRHVLGFFATDISGVFPKAVDTIPSRSFVVPVRDSSGNKQYASNGELIVDTQIITDFNTVNLDQVYYAHIGATKKLMDRVEALEAQVAALQAAAAPAPAP